MRLSTLILIMMFLACATMAFAGDEDCDDYYETYFDELLAADFDGDFPPEGWTVYSTATQTWKALDEANPFGIAPFGDSAAYVTGSTDVLSDEWLISPVISGSDCLFEDKGLTYDVNLQFWLDPEMVDSFDLEFGKTGLPGPDPNPNWIPWNMDNNSDHESGEWKVFDEHSDGAGNSFRVAFRFSVEPDESVVPAESFAVALDELVLGCFKYCTPPDPGDNPGDDDDDGDGDDDADDEQGDDDDDEDCDDDDSEDGGTCG